MSTKIDEAGLDLDLLRLLCETSGISGFEGRVQDIVTEAVRPLCDEVTRDRMGNVLAYRRARRSGGPRIMIAAHADEIGLMVSHVDAEGFLRFVPVGGVDLFASVSQRVLIHGREDVPGVIAPRIRGRYTEAELKIAPSVSDLYIDCALSHKEIVDLVRVGDPVSFVQDFRRIGSHAVTGKAFDDRLGVFSMIEALRALESRDAEVVAVSTVQEELGVRGAGVAAYAAAPDFGIAVDGGLAWDVPTTPAYDRRCTMGEGTAIYVMDRLTIGDERLIGFLVDLCERDGIDFQRNVGGGTDASAIQRTGIGAYATTVGAPTRYMHSTVQMADLRDIAATARLLARFVEESPRLFASIRQFAP